MEILTGNELLTLEAPEESRYQLKELMGCLNDKPRKVITLYGLKETGKTTLMRQAIYLLINQGVSENTIGLFIGEKGDSFIDLAEMICSNSNELKYIFVDNVDCFNGFLENGGFLYDEVVRVHGSSVVVAPYNLIALYIAEMDTLFDKCLNVKVPFLNFYEHCKFVLNTASPTSEQFSEYSKSGGLFKQCYTPLKYVRECFVGSFKDLFEVQQNQKALNWMCNKTKQLDWEDHVNNMLYIASAFNYIKENQENQVKQENSKLKQFCLGMKNPKVKIFGKDAPNRVVKEFYKYFDLEFLERCLLLGQTETACFLRFLDNCEFLATRVDQSKKTKCYVQAPFLSCYYLEEYFKAKAAEMTATPKESLILEQEFEDALLDRMRSVEMRNAWKLGESVEKPSSVEELMNIIYRCGESLYTPSGRTPNSTNKFDRK